MKFNSSKALEKALKGLLGGSVAAAIAAGLVWGFGESIPAIQGQEAALVSILAGVFVSIWETARNTWKHRKG